MRNVIAVALVVSATGALVAAQRGTTTRPAPAQARPAAARQSTAATCAADLGMGVTTRRVLCDLVIGTTPAESVSVTIPPHIGTATLRFDLHNRFAIPALVVPGALAFARHRTVAMVVRADRTVLGRAVVVREFRGVGDLFDQIGGGTRPGGVKGAAPGPAEPQVFTIPAGVAVVGIVGARLETFTQLGVEAFDTPGRPVGIVSNIRVEYRPGR